MGKRPGITFYFDDLPSIEQLENEVGEFFVGCMKYGETGEIPQFKGASRILWPMMKSKIDRDCKKYDETCKTNAYNRYKGICKDKGEVHLPQEEWEATVYSQRLTSVDGGQPSSPTGTGTEKETKTLTEKEEEDEKGAGEGSGGRRGRTNPLKPLEGDSDAEAEFEKIRQRKIQELEMMDR